MRSATRLTRLTRLAAAAAVATSLAGHAAAAVMVYTDRNVLSGHAAMAGTDNFADLSPGAGTAGPVARSAGPLAYQLAVADPVGAGAGAQELYVLSDGAGGNWVSTNYATSYLGFGGFDAPVRAIGGNFFATDFFGQPVDFELTFRVQDASGIFDYVLSHGSPDGFLSFVSDGLIESLTVMAGQGGVDRFVTVSQLSLGLVPEPDGVLLFGVGALALVGARRRRRHLLRGAVAAAALAGMSTAASAALNEPYAVRVAYDSAALRATVSWQADAPAAYGFALERRPVGRSTWVQVGSASAQQNSLADATVAPLTRYEYRVRAFRPGGPRTGYASAGTAVTPLNFPYNRGYSHGILPSNYSQAQMNADVRGMYGLWRATYVTSAGAGEGGMRVYKPAEGGETVSEGHGYGMLISVYMADDGNEGKSDFDRMLTYYKAKLKVNADGTSRGLMNWKIKADGTVADPWVAPDGDLDAAFSLLVADRKWGSGNGNPDYLAEARAILNALQKYAAFNRAPGASKLIANGDKDLGWQEGAANFTMSSYQMVGYMKQFAAASDSLRAAQWQDTLKAAYQAFNYFYRKNPGSALTPFTFLTQPGPSQYQKSAKGYTFGPDSCRVPWRVGLDYLWHGNTNAAWASSKDPAIAATLAQDMPRTNVQWFMTVTGGNPSNAWYQYNLDGTQAATYRWGQRHTAGSMAVGAMTDAASQASLNQLYDWMRQQIPGQDHTAGGYRVPKECYGDTVLMVNMLVVTGNMPNLPSAPVPQQ